MIHLKILILYWFWYYFCTAQRAPREQPGNSQQTIKKQLGSSKPKILILYWFLYYLCTTKIYVQSAIQSHFRPKRPARTRKKNSFTLDLLQKQVIRHKKGSLMYRFTCFHNSWKYWFYIGFCTIYVPPGLRPISDPDTLPAEMTAEGPQKKQYYVRLVAKTEDKA